MNVQHHFSGFYFRNPAPWEPGRQPDYHVDVIDYVDVPSLGPIRTGERQMTPAQADAIGLTIEELSEAINMAVLIEATALRARVVDLEQQVATLTAQASAISAPDPAPAE